MRPVTKDDFKAGREIRALCVRGNAYLEAGRWYYIRFMEKRGKVSVPLTSNPGLGKSNSGAEFVFSRFVIKEDD